MDEPVSGLARRLKASIKNFTGKTYPITVGDESTEDEEEQSDDTLESAEDSSQNDSDTESSAADGESDSNGDEPASEDDAESSSDDEAQPGDDTDEEDAPPAKARPRITIPKPVPIPRLPTATLAKAPQVWHIMRRVADNNVGVLKKAIKGHYADQHPELLKQIDEALKKLDDVVSKLDDRIADSLTKAHAAPDEGARKAELKQAKGILKEYIQYVKAEPLIAHIDKNPWVKIDLKKTLSETLTHMAQSIG
jgi:hypothetical protein